MIGYSTVQYSTVILTWMSYYKSHCDSWMWASAVTRSKLSHPFTTCLMLDRAPRMHMIANRTREKLRWVRIQSSVDE